MPGMGLAGGGIAARGGRSRFCCCERAGFAFGAVRQVEVEPGPLRARERPFVLVAEMVFAVAGADRELDRRLLHHAVVDVLQPVVEEAQLVAPPVLAVERMEVRTAMDAQLLVLRRRAGIALGGAAQVQPHAGPVADRPHRQVDVLPLRLLALERAAVEAVAHEPPQHVVLERVGIIAVGPTQHMMRHVRGEPAADEAVGENAAVIEDVAVLVGGAFPRHDAFQRRRLEVRHPPLRAGEERDPDGGDAAVAPGLMTGPFDGVVEIDRLLRRIEHGLSGRLAGAALVDAHADVAARHPPLRVHRLPVHVRVGPFLEIVRRNPELVFLVDAHVDEHGKMPVAVGPKDVGLQHGAIPHRDVDVLLDLQIVFGL